MDVVKTPFLTRVQLAARWHIAPGTLANWAARGEGPRSRTLGGRVLYQLADVEAWEAERWEQPAETTARTSSTTTTANPKGD